MSRTVIDTSIIIDHLRGFEAATVYLKGLEEGALEGIVSTITPTELFAGEQVTDDERAQIELLLALLDTVDVTPDIAREAGLLLAKYRRSHGLTPLDAIIAATARVLKTPLATRNVKDFEYISDLKVSCPY